MEMLRNEDLEILARGKERGYIRDVRLMAQELIARRAGANPEPDVAKQQVPYDYDGEVIVIPATLLRAGPYLDTITYVKAGQTVLFESSRGYRYIVKRLT